MNKQEFMAMSLPYGLKVQIKSDYPIVGKTIIKEYNCSMYGCEFNYKPIKSTPILHPLSDLTKEIEHKGEKFVPLYEFYEFTSVDKELIDLEEWGQELTYLIKNENPFQLKQFIKLVSWHFDIAGLIEKGEAIDVNTLDINPYK